MKMKLIILSLVVPFLFIGCVPKVEKIQKIEPAKITKDIEEIIEINPDANSSINQDWWRVFEDKQLDTIIEKAISTAPSLKSIQERYKKANERIKAVKSQNLPSAEFTAMARRDRFNESVMPEPLGGETKSFYLSGIAVGYKFDFWNERKSELLAMQNLAYAQKLYIEDKKLALSSAIAKIYISWSFDEQKIELLKRILKNYEKQLKIEKIRYSSGLISEISINRHNADIYDTNYKILMLKEVIESKKESICILGGFLPSVSESFTVPVATKKVSLDVKKEIYLNLISQRPDIAMQSYIVKSNSNFIENAKAKFYPNINLSALLSSVTLNFSDLVNTDSFGAGGGVALDLPIFDWGRREANLGTKEANYNSSVYRYNDLVIKAANEVVGTLTRLRYKQSQIDEYKKAKEAKVKNERIAQKRFSIGLSNQMPLLQSKLVVLGSEMEDISLKQSSNQLYIELIKALGGGFREDDSDS